MAMAESFEIKKKTNILSEDDLNGHIVKLKTNSEELFAFADSGSPMSFLNEKTVRRGAFNKTINQPYSNASYGMTWPGIWHAIMSKQ